MNSTPDAVRADTSPTPDDEPSTGDLAKSVEVAVIQRVAVAAGAYETRASTFVIETTSCAEEEWVYIGDGENQMIEVTVESIRRIGSVLAQAFGASSVSRDSGSTPR